MLVRRPSLTDANYEFEFVSTGEQRSPALVRVGTYAGSALPHEAGTALEVTVNSAALSGGDGANPPLAMCVEAQATLVRVRDHQEIYSFPIHYRSKPQKFVRWAAHDARLFREEIERCYHELSTGIADKLVSQKLLSPREAPSSIFAGSANTVRSQTED